MVSSLVPPMSWKGRPAPVPFYARGWVSSGRAGSWLRVSLACSARSGGGLASFALVLEGELEVLLDPPLLTPLRLERSTLTLPLRLRVLDNLPGRRGRHRPHERAGWRRSGKDAGWRRGGRS